jgi:hypothetical protein
MKVPHGWDLVIVGLVILALVWPDIQYQWDRLRRWWDRKCSGRY